MADPTPPEKVLLTWTAPSRLFQPKSPRFFSTPIVIAVLVGIILAIAGEWMLIAVLAALIFAYYLWSTVPPEPTSYSLTSLGLRAHNQLFRWPEMDRWWTEDKWGHTVLVIDTPTHFPPRLHLIYDSSVAKSLLQVMTEHLLQEKPEPTSLDKAGSWLSAKFPLDQSS